MMTIRSHVIIAILAAILSLAACAVPGEPGTSGPTSTLVAPAVSPSDLGLSGRLIFTGSAQSIDQYDLAANQVTPLFEAPRNAFVTAGAVSPDASVVVFSYAPPPEGNAQLGYSDLYAMPLQTPAAPTPLLEGSARQEVYSYPAWSPDGKTLYYGHTLPASRTGGAAEGPRIERIAYPGGAPEIVQRGASYPRLSPDGKRLAYITFEPDLSGNEILLANPDGSDPVRIVPQTDFAAIDSPIFLPDGRLIVFSAVENTPASTAPGFTRWPGVRVARAHNVPSDLWRVPAAGGAPERLTRIGCTGLFASYSPDGRHIAFMCDAGFFIMNPDGSNLGLLNPKGGLGTMEWIP